MHSLAVFALPALAAIALLIATAFVLLRRKRPTAAAPGLRDHEFNALVADSFRQQGYQLVDAARSGRDAQADLLLRRERQTFVVLTTHHRAAKVGVEALQALHRTMGVHGASGGFALTTGRFSRDAVAFAGNCNIRLIDGAALGTLLGRSGSTRKPATARDRNPSQ